MNLTIIECRIIRTTHYVVRTCFSDIGCSSSSATSSCSCYNTPTCSDKRTRKYHGWCGLVSHTTCRLESGTIGWWEWTYSRTRSAESEITRSTDDVVFEIRKSTAISCSTTCIRDRRIRSIGRNQWIGCEGSTRRRSDNFHIRGITIVIRIGISWIADGRNIGIDSSEDRTV